MSRFKIIPIILLLTFLLAACGPAATGTSQEARGVEMVEAL